MRLKQIFKKKVVFSTGQSVPDDELIEKFAYPGHPLMDGMMCVLDNHFSNLVNNAMDADTKEKESKAVAGMEALMSYKADIEDYMAAALEKIEKEASKTN